MESKSTNLILRCNIQRMCILLGFGDLHNILVQHPEMTIAFHMEYE